ncbi:spore protein, partial [Bacillus cereus]
MNIQIYSNDNNEALISAAASTIEQMKYEIARELGVTL